MQKKSANYQIKKRKTTPQLKERDEVYLLIKNLKTRKKSKKLNYVKVKLFLIKVKKRTISYKFELSQKTKVQTLFHVLLLELADSKTSVQIKFLF